MAKEASDKRISKGEITKHKLYDSAAKLFNQYDFKDVTVDRIVEEAGVAKGTFYIYFESKDALIAAFIVDYVSKVDTDYRAVLDSFPPDASASQKLLGLIEKIADTLNKTIGYSSMRTVYKLLLSDTIDTSAIKGYYRELNQMFSEVLKLGFDRGEFRSEYSLDELTKHLVMAIRGICYEWCIRYPDLDLKAQAVSHFQILLKGIK